MSVKKIDERKTIQEQLQEIKPLVKQTQEPMKQRKTKKPTN